MALANMIWTRVTVHGMVAEFLRAERNRVQQSIPSADITLIDSPDISDPQTNHTRLRYLHLIRSRLIGEIPPDTRWYEVRNLTDRDCQSYM